MEREEGKQKRRDRETRSSNCNAVSLMLNLNLFLSSLESISLSRQGKPWNGGITSCVVVIYVFLLDYSCDIATSEPCAVECIPANKLFFLMHAIILFRINFSTVDVIAHSITQSQHVLTKLSYLQMLKIAFKDKFFQFVKYNLWVHRMAWKCYHFTAL